MTKFRMEKAIGQLIIKHKTFSPKELRDLMLTEYNVERTPESITMLFKRHPEMLEVLKAQVRVEDQQHETIRYERLYWLDPESMKSSIPIIQKWLDTMIFRKVQFVSIKRRILTIKNVCEGYRGKGKDRERIIEWNIHPLALTEEKAIEYLTELNKKDHDDTYFRLVLRNFLIYAKGEVPTRINGEVPLGKNLTEYFTDEAVDKIYYVLDHDPEYADNNLKRTVAFMHYTMTRVMATCNTPKNAFQSFRFNGHELMQVTVYDKGKVDKKKRVKIIMPILQRILNECGLPKNPFPYRPHDLREQLKKLYAKAGVSQPKQPAHVWRHTGAMYWLRKSGWNYTLVCAIGGWTDDKVLRKCYGAPEMKDIAKFALELD